MTTILNIDYNVNILKALLWQYNKATNIEGILEAKQTWYNEAQRDFWQNWFDDVFNLDTANDFGCIVWALILGLSTTLFTNPIPNSRRPWGFDTTNPTNFFNYNFSSSSSSQITFTLAEKRLILKLRYRKLVSRACIPETNKILQDLIVPTYGPCHMRDNLDMSQTLVCGFRIPSSLGIILTEFDLLPRPAGVLMNVISTFQPIWGFGPTNTNFNHGGFYPD